MDRRKAQSSIDIALAFLLVCTTLVVASYAFNSNNSRLNEKLELAFLERRAITTGDWLLKHCTDGFASCDGNATYSHLVSYEKIKSADAGQISERLGFRRDEKLGLSVKFTANETYLMRAENPSRHRACVKRFAKLATPGQADEWGLPIVAISVCVGAEK